jgi:hypothetical protein
MGGHSIALPPLPGQRGYAGETVELSHQLDGTLRIFRGDSLWLTLPLRSKSTPSADPLHAARRQNQKPRCPASTTSPPAPLWRPLLNHRG